MSGGGSFTEPGYLQLRLADSVFVNLYHTVSRGLVPWEKGRETSFFFFFLYLKVALKNNKVLLNQRVVISLLLLLRGTGLASTDCPGPAPFPQDTGWGWRVCQGPGNLLLPQRDTDTHHTPPSSAQRWVGAHPLVRFLLCSSDTSGLILPLFRLYPKDRNSSLPKAAVFPM